MTATPKQYALAWYELLQDKKTAKDMNQNMLAHLHKTGRLSWLSEIVRNLEEIEHRQSGIERATITSARAILDKDAKRMAKAILKIDEVVVSREINPDLIAGIQVETKNKRWDLSLKNQLLSLSKQLQT